MNAADNLALSRTGGDVLAMTFQIHGFAGRWRFDSRFVHDGIVTDGARRMDLGGTWRARVHDIQPTAEAEAAWERGLASLRALGPAYTESVGGAIGVVSAT